MKSTIVSLLVLCKKNYHGIPCMFFMFGVLVGIQARELVELLVLVFKYLH